mgnify:CR=1 FL=1
MTLSTSAAYVRGLARGYRLAGRSLWRQCFLALLVWCLCVGSGIGFLWAAGEHYFQIVSGESIQKVIIHKWTGYWRVQGEQAFKAGGE